MPCWDMTEEGFALIVGRYTGSEPLAWQIAYHTEFQRMKGLLGRAGAPTAHALFESKAEPEHRENVVAFQGPPKPQHDLFSEPFKYHYPNDDAEQDAPLHAADIDDAFLESEPNAVAYGPVIVKMRCRSTTRMTEISYPPTQRFQ